MGGCRSCGPERPHAAGSEVLLLDKCGSDVCELSLVAGGEGKVNFLWVPPVG